MDIWSLALYGLPLIGILGVYIWRQRRTHERNLKVQDEASAAGLTEPASLHPSIDASR